MIKQLAEKLFAIEGSDWGPDGMTDQAIDLLYDLLSTIITGHKSLKFKSNICCGSYGRTVDEGYIVCAVCGEALLQIENVKCSGEWISGSGGHRVHSSCDQKATWTAETDMFAYCDEHMAEHEKSYYTRKDK